MENFYIVKQKIVIREIKMTDSNQILSAMACPEINAMHSNGFKEISDVDRYIDVLIKEYQNKNYRTLGIVEKVSNTLCGTITIDKHKFFSRAELGYWISIPNRNKGYASEAVKAIIDYGFSTLDVNRIQAYHDINNPASGRVLENAGMIYEGTLRLYNGVSDKKMYSIIKSDKIKLN